jgi:CheY-like chemotaxis protein
MVVQYPCEGVLVVDDDKDIRESITEILEDEGYPVALASNGCEALKRLRAGSDSSRPCVILLDLMMPIMDGGQFITEQMSDPSLSGIPVVVVTADGRAAQKAAALGAANGLAKPIRIDELLDAVGQFCSPPGN